MKSLSLSLLEIGEYFFQISLSLLDWTFLPLVAQWQDALNQINWAINFFTVSSCSYEENSTFVIENFHKIPII